MHILLVTWNYPPKVGGMENMLSQLVKQWQKTEHVAVIGPFSKEKNVADKAIRPAKDGLFRYLFFSFYSGIKLLRKKEIDVILAGSALTTPVVVVLGLMFRLPVVTQIHGLDIIYNSPFYQFLVRTLLPRCKLILANSSNTKRLAIKNGVDEHLIKVINPGLAFSEFDEMPEIESLSTELSLNNHKILLSAGRLAARKGIPEFIENVLPRIVESHPDLLLLIAGDNPSQSLTHKEDIKSRITASIEKKGLSEHVQILGQIDRSILLQLYFLADIFILPAIKTKNDVEGFGIVLIEAGAAGCPAIATAIGGIPDAIEDGKSGLLVEPDDWEGMANTLNRLLQDTEKRISMGVFSRQRVRDNFDWSVVGQKYLHEISRVIKSDGKQ